MPRVSRPLLALDVGIDLAAGLTRRGAAVVRTGVRVARPFAGLVLRPAKASPTLLPYAQLTAMAERGRVIRDRGEEQASAALNYLIPVVLDAVLDKVDMNAIAAKIDLNAVIGRLDLGTIAREVIEGIDLPELIRESSGAMASETVVGVRLRGIEADERISRIIDRVILRRRGRDALVDDREAGPDVVG